MHAKPKNNKNKKLLIGGIIAVLAVLVILISVLISSCSKSTRFDKYYEEGARYYQSGDYDSAAESLEKALKYGESVDCYVLLANTYFNGLNDIDKAIDVLYSGSYKLDSVTIDTYLEKLKEYKTGGEHGDEDVVTVCGEFISRDVTSLVLSQKRLTDNDIVPLSELKKLESLSLTDNGITDITPLSALTELNFLQLGNNQISDISPLAGLSKLRTLYLDGNPIVDLAPLKSLSSLTTLSLKNTGIDADELKELENALPRCSIHCEAEEENKIEEITLGGVTFKTDVTELDLSGKGISDLQELSKCRKLQKLDLSKNKISDITPIMELSDLEWLCLSDNEIEDILPLMGLDNLKYLDIDHNKVKDVTAVSALVQLEKLFLNYNELDSVKPVSKLTLLTYLGLKGTGLEDEDLKLLGGLTTLNDLAIEDNAALTGEAVDTLKGTLSKCNITHSDLLYTAIIGSEFHKSDETDITASGGAVTSLFGLSNFADLQALHLTNTAVSDLSPLKDLKNLEVLELWCSDSSLRGPLSDISALASVGSLTNVNFMWEQISDISALGASTGMRELLLCGNNVSDISALANMGNLESLNLDHCPVSDISVLSSLRSLRSLSLQHCGISDISSIASLTGLRELYLDGNDIDDLSSLEGLTKLNYLYISGNSLEPEQVLYLQEILPDCNIYTDLDLTVEMPEEEIEAEGETE